MPRKGFAGAAVVTTLTSNIASSGTGTFTIASATGWTFTTTPFVVVVDRGLPAEEKILCSGIAGTTITMQTRGYDGTTQAAHNAPTAQVIHVYDSIEAESSNAHVFDTTRNDHTQYARLAAANTFTGDQATSGKFIAPTGGAGEGYRIGDDVGLHDINQANTFGVRGVADANKGAIQLGSGGPTIGGIGNTAFTVDQADLAASLRTVSVVTGGGILALDSSYNVRWTDRLIVISNGNHAGFATSGYFDIGPSPTSGTITGVGGASNKTATSAGIPLAAWDALYYILPIGLGNTFLPANLRAVYYTAGLVIPPHWVPICIRNGDAVPNYVRWCTGHITPPGVALDAGEAFGNRAEALGWLVVNP